MGQPEPDLEPLPALARTLHPVELDPPQRAVGRHGGAQLSQQAPRAILDPTTPLSAAESQPDETPAIGMCPARPQSGGRRPENAGPTLPSRSQPGSGPARGFRNVAGH